MYLCKVHKYMSWCRREASNPGPAAYRAAALPTELQRHGGKGRIRTHAPSFRRPHGFQDRGHKPLAHFSVQWII